MVVKSIGMLFMTMKPGSIIMGHIGWTLVNYQYQEQLVTSPLKKINKAILFPVNLKYPKESLTIDK